MRILGVNIFDNKHIFIGLTKIYGIGISTAKKICNNINISCNKLVKNLNDYELKKLRKEILKYNIEGDLRRKTFSNIKRLIDLKCYRGVRHVLKLPVRGQRTRTNARTRKGSKKKKKIFKK